MVLFSADSFLIGAFDRENHSPDNNPVELRNDESLPFPKDCRKVFPEVSMTQYTPIPASHESGTASPQLDRYSGLSGATVYALFVLGVGAAFVLIMSLLLGVLVPVPGLAGIFLMRMLLIVVLVAVISGVSRYLAHARFQKLWELKLQREIGRAHV